MQDSTGRKPWFARRWCRVAVFGLAVCLVIAASTFSSLGSETLIATMSTSQSSSIQSVAVVAELSASDKALFSWPDDVNGDFVFDGLKCPPPLRLVIDEAHNMKHCIISVKTGRPPDVYPIGTRLYSGVVGYWAFANESCACTGLEFVCVHHSFATARCVACACSAVSRHF